jgi:GNAT superfamily N-acetyltransferase
MYPEKEIKEMALPNDFDGIHFGLYHNDELTGVVSLFEKGTTAQFRKMAVLPGDQGKGFGTQLLQYVIDFCRQEGIQLLWCNARTSAIEFYKKIGFVTTGEPYLQDQSAYIRMEIKV